MLPIPALVSMPITSESPRSPRTPSSMKRSHTVTTPPSWLKKKLMQSIKHRKYSESSKSQENVRIGGSGIETGSSPNITITAQEDAKENSEVSIGENVQETTIQDQKSSEHEKPAKVIKNIVERMHNQINKCYAMIRVKTSRNFVDENSDRMLLLH